MGQFLASVLQVVSSNASASASASRLAVTSYKWFGDHSKSFAIPPLRFPNLKPGMQA